MSRQSPVVWNEGMLLAPQHLQQFERSLHQRITERMRAFQPFDWGFTQLEIDREALRNGRVALVAARGVFGDGTPFAMPEHDGLPPARAIEGHFDPRQEVLPVHLALPSARPGRPEVGPAGLPGTPVPRYSPVEETVLDAVTGTDERTITVARRNLLLLFPDDALGDHETLPLAEVKRTAEGGFTLRDEFIPPLLAVGASEWLVRLLRTQHEKLIAKSSELGDMRRQRGGPADFASQDSVNFWILHTVNGVIPALAHDLAHRRAHPEQAYLTLAGLAGMLCTLSAEVHPKDLPGYDHGALERTFRGLEAVLSRLLMVRGTDRAVRIDLVKDGAFLVGRFDDPRLVEPPTQLFLGVRADVDEQVLVRDLPAKLKIASLDRIDFVIASALRGLPIQFTRVPPAGLPVKSNHVYFELEQRGDLWEGIRGAKNLALFVPPEYAGMALELLGLRG